MAVKISEKPNRRAYNMGSPVRGSNGSRWLTAKWSVGPWLTNDKNPGRCEGWEVWWTISLYHLSNKVWKTLYYKRKTNDVNKKEWSFNLRNFKCTDGKTYDRGADFYPVKSGWCIRYVGVRVRPFNSKGNGEWHYATRKFFQPRKPSISIKQNDNGEVEYTVTHDPGNDYRENWSTRVQVWRYNSRTMTSKLA